MTTRKQYFDDKLRGDDDPWRCNSSWYERRKRALALAALHVSVLAIGLSRGAGTVRSPRNSRRAAIGCCVRIFRRVR